MTKPKVILIGYGRFGKTLFEKLEKISEVAAVFSSSRSDELLALERERGVAVLGGFRRQTLGASWAVIATPTSTHAKIVIDCLDAGLNVFCEKPLTEDPSLAQQTIERAKKKNKKLFIDDVFLWRDEYKRLKEQYMPLLSIEFYMTKYGTFTDSLINAHVYHDFYMLFDLTGFSRIQNVRIVHAAAPLEARRVDMLEFTCKAGNTSVHGFYDRTERKKHKSVTLNSSIFWSDNEVSINGRREVFPDRDVLLTMLQSVFSENVDYGYNNTLALDTIYGVDTLRRIMQTYPVIKA